MKRKLMTLAALTATMGLTAQQTVNVYSVYDVNHDTNVQVDDAVNVANAVLTEAADGNKVVDAAELNTLLKSIFDKLESIDSRLSVLERNQCGCGGSDAKDENGIAANGHEYVDLGLTDEAGRTIYWATCNVGADKPEDAGLYFAWGETVGYTSDTNDGRKFDWANYKWMKPGCSSFKNITKYTFADGQTSADWYSNGEFIGDNKKVLDLEDDAAHVNWGGDWRMPTRAEQDQLCTKCTWTWDSTKKGYTVKGPNGNSIFLPAILYTYLCKKSSN